MLFRTTLLAPRIESSCATACWFDCQQFATDVLWRKMQLSLRVEQIPLPPFMKQRLFASNAPKEPCEKGIVEFFHRRVSQSRFLVAAVNQDHGARALISVGIAPGDVGVLDGWEHQPRTAAKMLDLYCPPQLDSPVAAHQFDADWEIARRHAFLHGRLDSERLPLTARRLLDCNSFPISRK